MPLIPLSSIFAISPQIGPDDLDLAAEQGVTAIVCNRPDGEDAGQPDAAIVAAWAAERGMSFSFMPVGGAGITNEAVTEMSALLDTQTPVLAYCRSGMRSALVWAFGQARRGMPVEDILVATDAVGLDFRGFAAALRSQSGDPDDQIS